MFTLTKAHDGDNDGFVHDGKPGMRPKGPGDTPKGPPRKRALKGALNRDVKPGLSAGGERISAGEREKALKRLMKLGKENPVVYRAITNNVDRQLHELGLSDLEPREKQRLIEWVLRNATKNDVIGRRRVTGKNTKQAQRAAQRAIDDEEKRQGELDRLGGRKLPQGKLRTGDQGGKVRRVPGAPQKDSQSRPGRVKPQVWAAGAAALGLRKKSQVRRKKLSQQNIKNPQGPKQDHRDPTANKAMRGLKDTPGPTTRRKAAEQLGDRAPSKKRAERRKKGGGLDESERWTLELHRRMAEAEAAEDEEALKALRLIMRAKEEADRKAAKARETRKRQAKKRRDDIEKKSRTKGLLRLLRAGISRAKFDESKHRRDWRGRFTDKPDVPDDKMARRAQMTEALRAKGYDLPAGVSRGQRAPKNVLVKPGTKAAERALAARPKPKKQKAAPKKAKKADVVPEKPKSQRSRRRVTADFDADKPIKSRSNRPARPKKLDDIDALIEADRNTVFDNVIDSLNSGDGRFKSLLKTSGAQKTLSLSALFEDGSGKRRFIKRTAYDPNAERGDVTGQAVADVHTDYAITSLWNRLGWRSQRTLGFVSDPNDMQKAAIMMEDVSETFGGKKMTKPKSTPKAVREAKWADRSEFVKMMLMDYVTNNHDRHENNWMEYEDEDGRHIVAIDHSMAGSVAARAFGQEALEQKRYESRSDPELVNDAYEAQAQRSFRGYISEGYSLSDTENYNAKIPQRIAVLYEGDEEALRRDLREALDALLEIEPFEFLSGLLRDSGVTDDDAFEEMGVLAEIIEGRLVEAEDGFDDMIAHIFELGEGWTDKRGKGKKMREEAIEDMKGWKW